MGTVASFRRCASILMVLAAAAQLATFVNGFVTPTTRYYNQQPYYEKHMASESFIRLNGVCNNDNDVSLSRRGLLSRSVRTIGAAFLGSSVVGFSLLSQHEAWAAAERQPLDALLYRIVRVREATQQETRLISTGFFKDTQRANVKLAIKFMIENYRLNDAFVAAATYIDGSTNTKLEAGQVGQRAVQNLYTILEYFDAADVQNLKVGQLSGKDSLVLKGLDATRQSIDEFLTYFPKSTVDNVIAKVEYENELNVKEFDPELGTLVNMPVTKYR